MSIHVKRGNLIILKLTYFFPIQFMSSLSQYFIHGGWIGECDKAETSTSLNIFTIFMLIFTFRNFFFSR